MLPAELQQIISKTLRKDREERYHSAHELLQALKALRHNMEVDVELQRSSAARSWLHRKPALAALLLLLLVAALALVATLLLVNRQNITSVSARSIAPPTSGMTALPEKSIAVLPFENLSKDEENASFAGGVQDEILTDLAKVADLKVISRTSVMKYKSDVGTQSSRDRKSFRCFICGRRQCPTRGRASSGECAANRCAQRHTPLG